jgi:broad specificity phosphatase PhoE
MEVVLIRHARTASMPDTPPRLWGLSEDGRRAARALADNAMVRTLRLFAASHEPKAIQTAAAVADGRPVLQIADLGELDRSGAGWIESEAARLELVRAILDSPDVSIQGCEPAAHAQARFVRAVDALVQANPDGGLAVVSHGTVLSLYMAHLRGLPKADFDEWRRMHLPDLAVVDPNARTVTRDFAQ